MCYLLNFHMYLNMVFYLLWVFYGVLADYIRAGEVEDDIVKQKLINVLIILIIGIVLNYTHPKALSMIISFLSGAIYSQINFANQHAILFVINYFFSISALILSFYLKDIFLMAYCTMFIMPKIFTVIWSPKSLKDIIEGIPINNNSIKAMDLIKEDQLNQDEYEINNISIYSFLCTPYSDPVYYPVCKDGEIIKHCIYSKSELMSLYKNKSQSKLFLNNDDLFQKLPMIETGNPLHLKQVPEYISNSIINHFSSTTANH